LSARFLPVGTFVCLLRETLEADPHYADLWLEGEVSDFSRSSAGHVYFSLRDDDGCLKCVLFRGQVLRQHGLPKLGDQVIVHGGLSIYPRSGAMQLVVDLVRPAGLGAASLELEYLRQRLEADGLFDTLRKRQLPASPRTIGVVTSQHGAAWHDIIDVVGRRYPLVHLILSPAQVQGAGAANSIVDALSTLQVEQSVEVIILARGGGASDDLSAFNDERVVRSVFASRVPVITGVGHATDQTLVEGAADCCAPTPSAAAEMCVPSLADLCEQFHSLESRLSWSFDLRRGEAESVLRIVSRRLATSSPIKDVREREAEVNDVSKRLQRAAVSKVISEKQRLASANDVLAALAPAAVLRRGYAAIQRLEDGMPIFSVSQVEHGAQIVAVLEDGRLRSTVDKTLADPSGQSLGTR
jgi:exodeoxyribonuclease VII large subunit